MIARGNGIRSSVFCFFPLLGALSTCATTKYAPVIAEGAGAHVELRPGRINGSAGVMNLSGNFQVQVYDFADGCPAVRREDASKGFRGLIKLPVDTSTTFTVPTARRIVLEAVWDVDAPLQFGLVGGALVAATSDYENHCRAVLTFIPERGGSYVLTYLGPVRGQRGCSMTAVKAIKDAAGATTFVRPESFGVLKAIEGPPSVQPGGLCTLHP